MISKSRLEELIEQGAKIWCICDYTYHKSKPNKKIEYYDLSSEDVCISPAEFRDYGLRIYNSLGYWNDVRYENLFETKEEAEWYREFGCIERTERLELPTWEEIKQNLWGDGIKFTSKNSIYVLRFDVPVEYIPSIPSSIAIRLIDITNKKELLCIDFTKENYLKACRKAKELFLGEKDVKD